MSRLLVGIFGWRAPSTSRDEDPLGAFFQGSGESDVAPEVLLRIL